MIPLLGWHYLPPNAVFILPHLANKLVMQLKTIHISTGTLALATFLTLGRVARASNIAHILIENQRAEGQSYYENNNITLIGYDSDGKSKKSRAYD